MATAPFVAGVELGGTRAIAVLAQDRNVLARCVIPTESPDETLLSLRMELLKWHEVQKLSAIGVASFGPVQLDRREANYGSILKTPKPLWSGVPVLSALTKGIGCPSAIDTDVNGAALAEYRWGAGAGCGVLCYITLGTGVGGGFLMHGMPMHGAMHPELGHLRLRRALNDSFRGACGFHRDCVEGLISGPALRDRFGTDPADIADTDPRWQDVASDLAELVAAILLMNSAERILFGGGISMKRPFLIPIVRRLVAERLGTYLPFATAAKLADIIQLAGLGAEAGPLGAVALALEALERPRMPRRTNDAE